MAWIVKRETKKGGPRYDVRYRRPDGTVVSETFRLRAEADRYKRSVETDIDRGQWVDPRAGDVTLAEFAERFMATRPLLSVRTRDLYEGQLRLHILPMLGSTPLNKLSAPLVRDWCTACLSQPSANKNTVAKYYRLLNSILTLAVEEEVVLRNPCRIKAAGREQYDERPVATVAQVLDLASVVKPERRAFVLLPALTGLRIGEVLALRRRRVNVLHSRIEVLESTIEDKHGKQVTKEPKNREGTRSLLLDPFTASEVKRHLGDHVAVSPDAYLFTGAKGGLLRRAVWQQEWDRARQQVAGLPENFHFHDLRHTHGTLITQAGGSLADAMRRLGHSSPDAAMVYQHGTDERERKIIGIVGNLIEEALRDRDAEDPQRDGRAMEG
jgi:integrase